MQYIRYLYNRYIRIHFVDASLKPIIRWNKYTLDKKTRTEILKNGVE